LGTFISNANILDALLENYDSSSFCQKRVLYAQADVKVNDRILEIIWQTLLVRVQPEIILFYPSISSLLFSMVELFVVLLIIS
jgi:hypothetical protein